MTHKGDAPTKPPVGHHLAKIAAGFKINIGLQDVDDLPPKMKALLEQIRERDQS